MIIIIIVVGNGLTQPIDRSIEHRRHYQVNDDHVGRSVDEAIRLIQGFQYADKHGEVCPANWKPGDATIKPDQSEKMEYFSKAGL